MGDLLIDVDAGAPGRRVFASVDADLPSGLTLTARLTAPGGAVDWGSLRVGTAAAQVPVGPTGLRDADLVLAFSASSRPPTVARPPRPRVVTFTIM